MHDSKHFAFLGYVTVSLDNSRPTRIIFDIHQPSSFAIQTDDTELEKKLHDLFINVLKEDPAMLVPIEEEEIKLDAKVAVELLGLTEKDAESIQEIFERLIELSDGDLTKMTTAGLILLEIIVTTSIAKIVSDQGENEQSANEAFVKAANRAHPIVHDELVQAMLRISERAHGIIHETDKLLSEAKPEDNAGQA